MITDNLKGRVNSIQSLGTVDGPGIRFVVFMQGCNLRCGCCHNPDTWDYENDDAIECTPQELLEKALKYRTYYGEKGGVTLSGGEPLLQKEFAYEFFRLCHENGVNTCLDTSGSVIDQSVEKLISQTDRVLLDIKYQNDELYKKYVGCSLDKPVSFLNLLEKNKVPVTIRQVVIPTLNDNFQSMEFLIKLAEENQCVDKIELLPFKKICKVKYDRLGIDFPFEKYEIPGTEKMKELEKFISEKLASTAIEV